MQKRLIENVDYFVRVVHFPNRSTPAQVWVNDDGTFDIYIDDLAADVSAAIAHELEHIRKEHFYDDVRPVAQLEAEADRTPLGGALPCIGIFTLHDAETRTRGNGARI